MLLSGLQMFCAGIGKKRAIEVHLFGHDYNVYRRTRQALDSYVMPFDNGSATSDTGNKTDLKEVNIFN